MASGNNHACSASRVSVGPESDAAPGAGLPLVTVLITAYNRPDELRATLRAVRAQRYPALELLLIDDASSVTLEPVVREVWPEAHFFRNAHNLGLIGSRSLGLARARGCYILTLDDDSAPVEPDAIATAVARLEREPELGALTFRIHEGLAPPDHTVPPLAERYAHSFIGCGHMLRTAAVRMVGGYRDFFVYYGEEPEYAMRLLDRDWRILFFPHVVVHHRQSSVGRSHAKITAYNFRNTLWTVLLDVPMPQAIVEFLWKLFVGAIELVRQGNLRWAAWAVGSFLRGVPRALRLRAPMSAAAVRTYQALRFRQVLSAEALASARPPTARERWDWLHQVWLRRRHARAFWDRPRAGESEGVGEGAWTTRSP